MERVGGRVGQSALEGRWDVGMLEKLACWKVAFKRAKQENGESKRARQAKRERRYVTRDAGETGQGGEGGVSLFGACSADSLPLQQPRLAGKLQSRGFLQPLSACRQKLGNVVVWGARGARTPSQANPACKSKENI
mmetsp:Transcript_45435/g.97375  ORF Transcript_45435/g.97375 Transcript_45435/m.97375 type:complete len:136 (-) Transcript_45435:258-665(-)